MALALPAPPVVTVPVVGGTEFPVRRIFCVGRNYAAHAREMGHDPDREPPFFFTKPADAVVPSGSTIAYPPKTRDYQHEVELVVALGRGGREVPEIRAFELVFGYAVGLDMTRRDVQAEAKKQGRPWDMAKGFDQSAPCGAIAPVAKIGHVIEGAIRLSVNGVIRQQADISEMSWSVPEVIAHLSQWVALAPGDLIYTGTPAGVGAVTSGDRLEAHIDGLPDLVVTIGIMESATRWP